MEFMDHIKTMNAILEPLGTWSALAVRSQAIETITSLMSEQA
jgi:hypothetical protein